ECPAQIPRSFLRQAEDCIRDQAETGVEMCALPSAAEFFPGASRQVRRVRKRRREGNARAAQGTASGRESYTIQTCDPSVSRTARSEERRVGKGGRPRCAAPSFNHSLFGRAILRRRV